jgi:hypothetical protein
LFAQAPPKVRRLAEMISILAHQPWRVKPAHIAALVTGDDCWYGRASLGTVFDMGKPAGSCCGR